MSKKFLNGAQVSAAGQQMGGEGMSKGVGRRAGRQAQKRPQRAHGSLRDAGIERAAPGPQEQGRFGAASEGAGAEIGFDGLPNGRQNRNDPLFAALADDSNNIAFRHVAAGETQGFSDTKATTVKQGRKRLVAKTDPGFVREFRDGFQHG